MGQGDDWEIATLDSRQTAVMSRIALSQIGGIGPKANVATLFEIDALAADRERSLTLPPAPMFPL